MESVVNSVVLPLTNSSLPLGKRYIGIWVGIVSGNQTFSKGFGETRLDSGRSPDESTFFEIGSISKTFTGILLALRGLDLNSEAQSYLPKDVTLPRFKGSPIKLVDLVAHTSGLPSVPENISSLEEFLNYSPASAYGFLNNFTLKSSPGSSYEYSNLGMGLLAHILEGSHPDKQTLRFEKMVREITIPLGMHETAVFLNDAQKTRLAEAYDSDGKAEAHWDWRENSVNSGAGALRSTGRDMLMYLQANLGILRTPIEGAIQKSHQELFKKSDEHAVAYGWQLSKLGSDTVVWHNGGTGGFLSFTGFIKEKNLGIVVLANTSPSTEDGQPDDQIDFAGFRILTELR